MIERVLHRLGDVAGLCFAVALVISVYEVFARYLFNAPTNWVCGEWRVCDGARRAHARDGLD
jgi:TRAP-type mannitol/chloroaromatic compound transport system permease small subunit